MPLIAVAVLLAAGTAEPFQSSWGASPVCMSWAQLEGSWLGDSERFLGLGSLLQHLLQPLLPFMSTIQDNVSVDNGSS